MQSLFEWSEIHMLPVDVIVSFTIRTSRLGLSQDESSGVGMRMLCFIVCRIVMELCALFEKRVGKFLVIIHWGRDARIQRV
jgi:hypothetical protein